MIGTDFSQNMRRLARPASRELELIGGHAGAMATWVGPVRLHLERYLTPTCSFRKPVGRTDLGDKRSSRTERTRGSAGDCARRDHPR